MRARSAILAVAALAFVACIPRRMPVKAKTPMTVLVATVFDHADSPEVNGLPAEASRKIAAALAERNLRPKELGAEPSAAIFTSKRTTQQRMAALAESSDADLVLLVEASARFYSQLEGRYRWDVNARVTIARRVSLDQATSDELSAPAFLDFDHEREPEALTQASGRIAKEVGRLADEFLGGQASASEASERTAGSATGGRRPTEHGSTSLLDRPLDRTAWIAAAPAAVATPAGAAAAETAPRAESIYFVLVDRFANGDPANDGAIDPKDPQGFHGGDLKGVLDHLDDLASLGVKTVWLSPVFKMRTEKYGEYGAYHGYWVEDFEKVEPRFGTEAQLKELSDALHARGMTLYLDVVLNHVAPGSALVKQHPDWFHHEGGITDWNDPEQLVNREIFGLPDLAQENPAVYDFLLKDSLSWVTRVHPDGFRLDAARHMPLSFWKKYDADVHAKAGKSFALLGEMFDGNTATLAKTRNEAGFDAVFDFPLYFAMKDVFCDDAPPSRLASTIFADRVYGDPAALVTFLDNHDLPRLASACKGDDARVRDALTFLLTARGVPSLTYGTESGLDGAKEPENRADMRFDASSPRRALIHDLLALRAAHPALAERAATRFLALDESFFAYARIAGDEAAIVAVNRGATAATVKLPRDLVAADATDALTRESIPGPIRVAPRSTRVVLLSPRKGGYPTKYEMATRVVEFRARGAIGAGETAAVVGSGAELGDWDPARGVALSPRPGGELVGRATLPVGGAFEWKVVFRKGTEKPRWEPGANRPLLVEQAPGTQIVLAPPRLAAGTGAEIPR